MTPVELVAEVIRRVEEEGLGVLGGAGAPRGLAPARLDALRFPNGAALSPALRAWLAFDATYLGWFDDLDAPSLPRRDVAELARASFPSPRHHEPFRALLTEGTLTGDCYVVPGGKVARRFLYVGEPDASGEPPVLVLDPESPSFVAVEYPGIDVYLAVRARLVETPKPVFGSIAEDERFRPRMAEHVERCLRGSPSLKYGDIGFVGEAKVDVDVETARMLAPNEAVPEGWVVVQEFPNPLTRMPMRLAAPEAAVRPRGEAELG